MTPATMAEPGFGSLGEHLIVVEKTSQTYTVIVWTPCSCYPWLALGLPPSWYEIQPYRSGVTSQPCEVLREFGLGLDESMQIQVWNRTFQVRYMVLPERPAGTEEMTLMNSRPGSRGMR